MKKFFLDNTGKPSMIRLLAFISVIVGAVAIIAGFIVKNNTAILTGGGLMFGADTLKTVQKFGE